MGVVVPRENVADATLPPNEPEKPEPNPRYAGLRPIQPGEVRNKSGTNGWKKAQARIRRLMMQFDPEDPEKRRRFDKVILAAYDSSQLVGPKGAADRKLLTEQVAGKARQQYDLSNEDGTLQPVRGDAILSALQAAIAARKNEEEEQGAPPPGKPDDDGPAGG